MLDSRFKGFAVMTKDLSAYGFQDENFETCKKYCRNGDVIVKLIPSVCGFSISITWYKFWELFYFKHYPKNILWFHWTYRKEYKHKIGELVYNSEK